ncbi:hypothetical protein B0H66DRAFT_628398, partial [Apodospora peruviana]
YGLTRGIITLCDGSNWPSGWLPINETKRKRPCRLHRTRDVKSGLCAVFAAIVSVGSPASLSPSMSPSMSQDVTLLASPTSETPPHMTLPSGLESSVWPEVQPISGSALHHAPNPTSPNNCNHPYRRQRNRREEETGPLPDFQTDHFLPNAIVALCSPHNFSQATTIHCSGRGTSLGGNPSDRKAHLVE